MSTGPASEEGLRKSSRNSLKHGLCSTGLVLADQDAAEVARCRAALEAEHRPSTETARVLVGRMAVHATTMARCQQYQAARRAEALRNAAAEFQDHHLTRVEHDFDWLAGQPATSVRRLRGSPEGLDMMARCWEVIADDLNHPAGPRWGPAHSQRVVNLMGCREDGIAHGRLDALCRAMRDDFSRLDPAERAEADTKARQARLIAELTAFIAAQVAELKAELEQFDTTALKRDRDEAAARALFDATPEGALVRKYEAAAERGFYKALKELRQVEAEAAARRESEVSRDDAGDCAPLGSFLPAPAAESEPAEAAPAPKGYSQVNLRILPSFTGEEGVERPTGREFGPMNHRGTETQRKE